MASGRCGRDGRDPHFDDAPRQKSGWEMRIPSVETFPAVD